jgi:hypothetical protein
LNKIGETLKELEKMTRKRPLQHSSSIYLEVVTVLERSVYKRFYVRLLTFYNFVSDVTGNADFNKMILCAMWAQSLEIDCAHQTMSVPGA